ncbi:MAG: DUF971 domain-containing protein [Phycisphaerales bacterium]
MDGPRRLELKKEEGLVVEWADGTESFYPLGLLRKLSPSAEMRKLREEQARNPLTVLPASAARASSGAPLRAESAELVGNYALRIRFNDGHETGLYSWAYLREIDPARKKT